MKKLVTFDVASPFGFFRKNFTTTNALTFSVIPRSAVEGLIGSIVGIDRESFPRLLESSKIAVQLMSKVRKINMKYMHINHDWIYGPLNRYLSGRQFILQKMRAPMSTAASVELLVNPFYRIYVDTNSEDINNNLASNIRNKQSYYTPYLGGSSYICSLRYIGEYEYEKDVSNGLYRKVSSIIPYTNNRMPRIQLEKGVSFASEEDIAIHIDDERRSQGTYGVLYNTSVGCLQLSDKDIQKVNNGAYIKFLPMSV